MKLPTEAGTLLDYSPIGGPSYPSTASAPKTRVAYAAAHVVADPLADGDLDWEATLAFRRHLWSLGLGVAEAMDTAQRGMGLDWERARRLIELTCTEAGGPVVAGAQTDHLAPGSADSLAAVTEAYLEQCEVVEGAGGNVVLMASRELCRIAAGPEDYAEVYGAVLTRLERPAILHWLGEMFDPALRGYWGAVDYETASAACLAIIDANADRIAGIKISLLEQAKETDLRRRLPSGVRMYTGDDFDYPTTIADDSDALLGAFDFAAPAAAWAFEALDAGDVDEFKRRLEPTVPLSRHVFGAPTAYYKTGVVFLAYLNGFQSHFRMVGGLESARSITHLATAFRLADAAGLLRDAELAAHRMQQVLAVAGLGA
jgi:hypothetical protein